MKAAKRGDQNEASVDNCSAHEGKEAEERGRSLCGRGGYQEGQESDSDDVLRMASEWMTLSSEARQIAFLEWFRGITVKRRSP